MYPLFNKPLVFAFNEYSWIFLVSDIIDNYTSIIMKIIDNVKQYRCKTSDVITDFHDIPLNFISTNCGQSQYHISKTIQLI